MAIGAVLMEPDWDYCHNSLEKGGSVLVSVSSVQGHVSAHVRS